MDFDISYFDNCSLNVSSFLYRLPQHFNSPLNETLFSYFCLRTKSEQFLKIDRINRPILIIRPRIGIDLYFTPQISHNKQKEFFSGKKASDYSSSNENYRRQHLPKISTT